MDNKEIVLKVLAIMPDAESILSQTDIDIEEKSGIGNLVTSVDKKLENYLVNTLQTIFPESQIIAEESADSTTVVQENSLKFIVDPLDGTTNYTNGWSHTISIGIVNGSELSGGIIYDALNKKIYSGITGDGVIECDINDITNIQKVNQPTYDQNQIRKAVISYDTPYGAEAYKITQKMAEKLYLKGASLKTVGPISLDVLKTALGKANRPHDYNCATWHSEVRAWDLAAATAILREFSGEIIGEDGKPLSIQTLTSPTKKIAFIASGNEILLNQLYENYKEIL
jgi:myo-inositol-1(or 4)-monophosphatase